MTGNGYFSTRFGSHDDRDRTWQIIADYLGRYIGKNDRVADIGAGYCSFINNTECGEKHAVDVVPEFVKWAGPGVKTHVAEAADLSPLESGYFDTVFSSNLLEHLPYKELEAALKEIRRILKINGKLILILPNYKYCYRDYFDDYTHRTPLSDAAVCDWLRSLGFVIERNSPKFLPFSFKSSLPKTRLLVWLYLRLPFKILGRQMLIVARKTGDQY